MSAMRLAVESAWCLVLFGLLSCVSQAEGKLHRIEDHGLVGFIDRSGAVVIEPRYLWARDFREGRAVVWSAEVDRVGAVDEQGNVVVPFQYEELQDFSGGLAWARREGKWVVVTATGQQVGDEHRYDDVTPYANGRAAVRVGSKWGYAGPMGRMVIEPQYDNAGRFARGVAPVWMHYGYEAYVDANGQVAIPRIFQTATPFVHQLTVAAMEGGHAGLIDVQGQFVVPARYRGWGEFSDGRIPLWGTRDDGTYVVTYFDESGRAMFSVEGGTSGGKWSCGRAVVAGGHLNERFIVDGNGAVVWTNTCDSINGEYRCGLIGVMDRSGEGIQRWGFRDVDGNMAIPMEYDLAGSFDDGLSLVHRGAGYYVTGGRAPAIWIEGGRWMYVDTSEETVWQAPHETGIYLGEIRSLLFPAHGHHSQGEQIRPEFVTELREAGRIPYRREELRRLSDFFRSKECE